MAGRYTDEERLARGQYQDASGQWYTKSGYAVTEGGQNVRSEPRSGASGAAQAVQQTVQQPQTVAMQGTNYAAFEPVQRTMQGDYRAYSTNPYAQEAIAAQQSAIQNAMRQYDIQQRKVAEQNRIDKEAAEAARQAALQQSLLQYGVSRDQANRDAEAAARQAYISRMLQERDLAQQLSANGYSGGMTDSAYLRLLSNYENSRNAILTDRDRQLAALQLAMDNERAQAAADIANANAAYDRTYNDALADIAIARARTQYEGDQALAQLYAQMRDSMAEGSSSGSGAGSSSRTGIRSSDKKTKDGSDKTEADEAAKDALKLKKDELDSAIMADNPPKYSRGRQELKSEVQAYSSSASARRDYIDRMRSEGTISEADASWLKNTLGLQTAQPAMQMGETEARNLVMRSASTPVGQLEFLERMVNNGMISQEVGERLALYINR